MGYGRVFKPGKGRRRIPLFEAVGSGEQMATLPNTYNQKFGKYEILEELGRGGMGVVYKARDPIIGRLVALKTLTAASASDPNVLKRFYREAQSAGRLQHPNIITIFDMGEVDNTPYIAMSFLEGETLEKIIGGRQPLPVGQKLSIILQLCRGLDFAHQHGVVHRDVKPANVFLGQDGSVKVLDFGIVHIATTTMTSTGMVIGTIPYMSPEQVTGQHVDRRSDIFSVGTVAYELLTYARPFDGPNFPAIMYKIVNERPVLPTTLASGIPPELEQAVMRCLETRPEDRFQSLGEFVLEMEPLEQALKRQMISNLVGQGQELYQRKEYSQAREVLRGVLMLDSSHGFAKELMAKVNSELRHADVAVRILRLVEDGSRLLQAGSPAEAASVLEEVLGLDAENAQARSLLAEAQRRIEREKLLNEGLAAVRSALDRGNLTVAEAALSKVLELDAGSTEGEALQSRIKEARAHQRQLRLQEEAQVALAKKLIASERFQEAVDLPSLDSTSLPVVPFWKRRMVQLAAAGAAALLIVAALTWRALDHKPPQPAEPPRLTSTAAQRALEKEAQEYETEHRMQNALNVWNKLQAESGPLQKEAAEAARRDQEMTGQAEALFNNGKSAEKLGTRQGYEAARSDYSKAGQINADLKPEVDQAIQEIDLLLAGRSPAQIEQQNYSKAQQLWKEHRYPEAKAALQAIVEQDLPGSKLVKQARAQLSQVDGLIQDQQKYEDAKTAFNAQQYDKAQTEFQDLASGNTEWKAEAQEYLKQIHDLRTAAQQAASKAAIKAAEERVQEKVAARRYGEASALLPEVESAGGKTDSLKKTIEDAYHAELNSYKQQAAGNPTDAGLKSVLAEVQDLGRRAGPLNKDAADYELNLRDQLDRLNKPAVVPPAPPAPPPQQPPAPATPAALSPTITAVVPAERPWTDRIQDDMVVPAQFVRGGLHFAPKPALPDNLNARAHKGDEVNLNCTVSGDGEVKSCSPTSNTDFANLVAAAAKGWKFQGPILLDESSLRADKRTDKKVSARVAITVSY